ncbi:MAG TPA: hypothetical protein VH639_16480 [Bryobacteraceae bacterium]
MRFKLTTLRSPASWTYKPPPACPRGCRAGDITRPPPGRYMTVNANMGDIAREVRLGLSERLPEGKQNTGNSGSAGASVNALG